MDKVCSDAGGERRSLRQIGELERLADRDRGQFPGVDVVVGQEKPGAEYLDEGAERVLGPVARAPIRTQREPYARSVDAADPRRCDVTCRSAATTRTSRQTA